MIAIFLRTGMKGFPRQGGDVLFSIPAAIVSVFVPFSRMLHFPGEGDGDASSPVKAAVP